LGEEFGMPRSWKFGGDQKQENKENRVQLNSPSKSFLSVGVK